MSKWLILSDLQIPFEHADALKFCKYVKRHFKIPDENILNVGDELDEYWGGLYQQDINAEHTANQEIDEANKRLVDWYIAFPKMKLAISNHGTRYWRKALHANIPNQLLKSYQEVIKSPPGWEWKKSWLINCKHPFILEHGDDWGGQYPHKTAAIHNGISYAIGHHHSVAGVEYVKTNNYDIWGMSVGCLINFEKYAFNYARSYKFKPQIGCGIVLDEGKTAIWLPMK